MSLRSYTVNILTHRDSRAKLCVVSIGNDEGDGGFTPTEVFGPLTRDDEQLARQYPLTVTEALAHFEPGVAYLVDHQHEYFTEQIYTRK